MLKDFKFLLPLWKQAILPVFLSIIAVAISLTFPLFPKLFIDEVIINRKNIYFSLIISYAILTILFFFISYFKQYLFFRFQRNNILAIQEKVIEKVIRANYIFFEKTHSGYLSQRIKNDIEGLSTIFSSTLVFGIIQIIQQIGALFFLFNMNVRLSIISLLPLPFIILKSKKKNSLKELMGDILEESAKLSEVLTDMFSSVEFIKSSNNEKKAENKINLSLKAYNKKLILKEKNESYFFNLIEGIIRISEVIVWSYGIYLVQTNKISIGGLIAFTGYLFYLYQPAKSLMYIILSIEYGKKSFQRIKELLEIIPEVGTLSISKINNLEVKNLGFWYNINNQILQNINISLKNGDKLLISGDSGTGKTTLLKLLIGFYQKKEGEILWNLKPINLINKKKLMEEIGYISQNINIIKDTLINNITFGTKYKKNLKKVIKDCGLNFKNNNSLNFGRKILENGNNISGGEKQRIALARVLIKNPSVIILDEATTNLDEKTEDEIEKMVLKNFKDKIIIKVSHSHKDSRGWKVINLSKDENA